MEIVLPGLRDVGNGPSEQAHKQLQELRQSSKVQLWSLEGTAEECEKSWIEFCLQGCPDGWEVLS